MAYFGSSRELRPSIAECSNGALWGGSRLSFSLHFLSSTSLSSSPCSRCACAMLTRSSSRPQKRLTGTPPATAISSVSASECSRHAALRLLEREQCLDVRPYLVQASRAHEFAAAAAVDLPAAQNMCAHHRVLCTPQCRCTDRLASPRGLVNGALCNNSDLAAEDMEVLASGKANVKSKEQPCTSARQPHHQQASQERPSKLSASREPGAGRQTMQDAPPPPAAPVPQSCKKAQGRDEAASIERARTWVEGAAAQPPRLGYGRNRVSFMNLAKCSLRTGARRF
eukprot:365832-Chlamydomonas_euryale.AAC.7